MYESKQIEEDFNRLLRVLDRDVSDHPQPSRLVERREASRRLIDLLKERESPPEQAITLLADTLLDELNRKSGDKVGEMFSIEIHSTAICQHIAQELKNISLVSIVKNFDKETRVDLFEALVNSTDPKQEMSIRRPALQVLRRLLLYIPEIATQAELSDVVTLTKNAATILTPIQEIPRFQSEDTRIPMELDSIKIIGTLLFKRSNTTNIQEYCSEHLDDALSSNNLELRAWASISKVIVDDQASLPINRDPSSKSATRVNDVIVNLCDPEIGMDLGYYEDVLVILKEFVCVGIIDTTHSSLVFETAVDLSKGVLDFLISTPVCSLLTVLAKRGFLDKEEKYEAWSVMIYRIKHSTGSYAEVERELTADHLERFHAVVDKDEALAEAVQSLRTELDSEGDERAVIKGMSILATIDNLPQEIRETITCDICQKLVETEDPQRALAVAVKEIAELGELTSKQVSTLLGTIEQEIESPRRNVTNYVLWGLVYTVDHAHSNERLEEIVNILCNILLDLEHLSLEPAIISMKKIYSEYSISPELETKITEKLYDLNFQSHFLGHNHAMELISMIASKKGISDAQVMMIREVAFGVLEAPRDETGLGLSPGLAVKTLVMLNINGKLLESDNTKIFEFACSICREGSDTESYRASNSLRRLIENNMLSTHQVQQIIEPIFSVFEKNDARACDSAVKTLERALASGLEVNQLSRIFVSSDINDSEHPNLTAYFPDDDPEKSEIIMGMLFRIADDDAELFEQAMGELRSIIINKNINSKTKLRGVHIISKLTTTPSVDGAVVKE